VLDGLGDALQDYRHVIAQHRLGEWSCVRELAHALEPLQRESFASRSDEL
jgi:hypothetical protein